MTTTNNTQPVNSKERQNVNGTTAKTIGAATVVSASAGAGVLADELYRTNTEDSENVAEAATPETPQETVETPQEAQAPQAEAPQAAPQAAHHTAQQHTTEPQPTDHTSGADTPEASASTEPAAETPAAESDVTTDDLANVDPNVVSADIANAEFIDETDNDVANLPIASVGTIETADGDTLAAAALIDSGETMYLVDVNHDNQYDVITNEQGTAVAEVPGIITTSDGHELANLNNGQEDEYHGDDATDDYSPTIDEDMENDIIELS